MDAKSVKNILLILLIFLINVAADNGINKIISSETSDTYGRASTLDFQGQTIGESRIEKQNNLIVSKNFTQTGNSIIDIELRLETPPRPAKLDIVLAMDTSGSMIQNFYSNAGINATHMEWASKLFDAINKTPNARLSIVSWDDDADNVDRSTEFFEVSRDKSKIESELRNLSKECWETDHTIYSIGIKKAIHQLDSNIPTDPRNTSRIIIFVTGLSEFMAEPNNAIARNLSLKEQLDNASEYRTYGLNEKFYGYQIYPVQIGITHNSPWEADNITKISKETRISTKLPLNDNISISKISDLNKAIEMILERQKDMPVASNVTITDSLFPYLSVISSDSKIIKKNGSIKNIASEVLSRNPYALRWIVGNLSGEDEWIATIRAKINLNLPIEVNEMKRPVTFKISKQEYVSKINYTWMTGYDGSISIPQGRIEIDSKGEIEAYSDGKKQKGFEFLSGIIGLSLALFLCSRKTN